MSLYKTTKWSYRVLSIVYEEAITLRRCSRKIKGLPDGLVLGLGIVLGSLGVLELQSCWWVSTDCKLRSKVQLTELVGWAVGMAVGL